MMNDQIFYELAAAVYMVKELILPLPKCQLMENIGFFILGLRVRDTLTQKTAFDGHSVAGFIRIKNVLVLLCG